MPVRAATCMRMCTSPWTLFALPSTSAHGLCCLPPSSCYLAVGFKAMETELAAEAEAEDAGGAPPDVPTKVRCGALWCAAVRCGALWWAQHGGGAAGGAGRCSRPPPPPLLLLPTRRSWSKPISIPGLPTMLAARCSWSTSCCCSTRVPTGRVRPHQRHRAGARAAVRLRRAVG